MTAEEHIRHDRTLRSSAAGVVTNESALRHSAVWACLRLRANLISTLPIDVYRRFDGVQVEVPKPPVLVNPGGERVDVLEWMYSSQFDLDRAGNAFGLITERSETGLPARIDLQPFSEVSVRVKDGDVHKYKIGRLEYEPRDVWHERQYTVAGLHVGLSPVAYAAWAIGEYLSIQEFASEWFGNGATPKGHLKNTAKTLQPKEADAIKTKFKQSVQGGDVFVSGSDWEYNMMSVEQAATDWIEAKKYSIADIARFFDVPGDLIDAAVHSNSITYASVTQRNLQFLVMHLGPAIIRRETALGKLTPKPRYVKLNTDALLRMDPKSRAEMLKLQIDSRVRTPNEARELDELAPLTDGQKDEFDALFPQRQTPAKTGVEQ